MGKSPRSFSIDEDLNELLSERDDLNASAVVNNFLREYVAGGRGKEAALETRLSQLEDEIADLETDLRQKRRERDRIEEQLSREREDLYDAVDAFTTMIDNNEFDPANLDVENGAVNTYAARAGVPAERFIEEVEARL